MLYVYSILMQCPWCHLSLCLNVVFIFKQVRGEGHRVRSASISENHESVSSVFSVYSIRFRYFRNFQLCYIHNLLTIFLVFGYNYGARRVIYYKSLALRGFFLSHNNGLEVTRRLLGGSVKI